MSSKYNIQYRSTTNNNMSTPTQTPQPVGSSSKSSTSDPYATLGLSHDATPTQIKVAYRKLALQYHPDRQNCISSTPSSSSGGKQQQQQRRETRDDCGHSFASNTTGGSSGGASAKAQEAIIKETTDKFAHIAQAYSILSDPVKKKEYDHLYKFGAFDNVDKSGGSSATPSVPAATNNYRYAENLSGGYYKPGYTPPKPGTTAAQPSSSQFGGFSSAAAAQTAFQQHAQAFQSMQSQDSFFDDLLYSPKASSTSQHSTAAQQQQQDSNKTDPQMAQKKKQPGIGYSFKPLGKHLSIHVPSRNEIMMNMTAAQMSQMNMGNDTSGNGGNKGGCGGRSHLFGTRVTFSQNKIESTSGTGLLCGANAIHSCSDDTNVADQQLNSERGKKEGVKTPSRKVISTTTRIAKGKRRQVTRTAHLYPDGKKEIVIEEDGIVRRRYVEEASTPLSPNVNNNSGENNGNKENGQKGDNETTPNRKQGSAGGLQKEESGKFTILGLLRACYSPCASAAG